MPLGDELRQARVDARLTQEELAHRAGLHRTYVSMLERDASSPTVEVLLRLADALQISAAELLARVERKR